MKYDLTKVINDLDGEPLKTPNGAQPLTAAWVVRRAVGEGATPNAAPRSVQQQFEAYEILTALKKPEVVNLSAEQVVAVKTALATNVAPFVFGQIMEILS